VGKLLVSFGGILRSVEDLDCPTLCGFESLCEQEGELGDDIRVGLGLY
jgi:hypothetical protein